MYFGAVTAHVQPAQVFSARSSTFCAIKRCAVCLSSRNSGEQAKKQDREADRGKESRSRRSTVFPPCLSSLAVLSFEFTIYHLLSIFSPPVCFRAC